MKHFERTQIELFNIFAALLYQAERYRSFNISSEKESKRKICFFCTRYFLVLYRQDTDLTSEASMKYSNDKKRLFWKLCCLSANSTTRGRGRAREGTAPCLGPFLVWQQISSTRLIQFRLGTTQVSGFALPL